ncbi:MAG TPA: hypothetical protein DCP73_02740 [Chloroflexi bacterium]|nr:hypothetical protein [Chloroflexota bacterium]
MLNLGLVLIDINFAARELTLEYREHLIAVFRVRQRSGKVSTLQAVLGEFGSALPITRLVFGSRRPPDEPSWQADDSGCDRSGDGQTDQQDDQGKGGDHGHKREGNQARRYPDHWPDDRWNEDTEKDDRGNRTPQKPAHRPCSTLPLHVPVRP